jgi:UDP-N-acetylmuramoyl-tripeptide--D-alanyl-D-alanine ligase
MDIALEIVKPKIGIITGIAPVHTDKEHLGSLENVIKEKQKLIQSLPRDGYAILNFDDEKVRAMAPHTKAHIIWYGTDKKNCDIWVDPKTVKLSLEGTSFILQGRTLHMDLQTSLIGKHHIYTIMATYSTLESIKKLQNISYSIEQFSEILKTIKPLPGRMSVEKGPLETMLLNDSLRANPSSTKSGLETLSEISYSKGRKIAVLAEMGELKKPEEEHKNIIDLVKKLDINYVITIGNLYPESPDILHTKNVHEAAETLKKMVKKDDLVYLKGSLLRHIERVRYLLEGRRVGCLVTLCPFYIHCSDCRYLTRGYVPSSIGSGN